MKAPQPKSIAQTKEHLPVFYTIWQDAWLAITQPRQFVQWAVQPLSRSIKYLLIILAVMSLISTVYYYLIVLPFVQDFRVWVEEAVPTVTFQDNQLFIENEEAISFTDSDEFFFKVDPTIGIEDEPGIDTFYEVGILIIRDAVVIRTEGETEIIPYLGEGIEDFQFDGAALSNWIDLYFVKSAFILVPLAVFAYLAVAKLLYSLIFSFLFFLFTGFRLDFKHIWSMSIYALTPAILAGYISFIFYPLAGFYTLIFLVYMTLAMSNYRRFAAKN